MSTPTGGATGGLSFSCCKAREMLAFYRLGIKRVVLGTRDGGVPQAGSTTRTNTYTRVASDEEAAHTPALEPMLSRSLTKIFLLSFVVLVCMHRLVRPRSAAVVGRAFSSYTAELVALRARGALFPKGRAEMYRAFLRDVQRDTKRNDEIPPRPRLSPRNPRLAALELPKPPRRPRGLRVMSFNVHFWQRGYSSRLYGDNQEACVEAVRRHQPDVLLLQEVVPTDVAAGGAYDALGALARLGYIHRVMVAAPEVHALMRVRMVQCIRCRHHHDMHMRTGCRCTRSPTSPRTARRRHGGCRVPSSAATRCAARVACRSATAASAAARRPTPSCRWRRVVAAVAVAALAPEAGAEVVRWWLCTRCTRRRAAPQRRD